ncbi:MAG: helix-turn-helix domain-containing protein [Paenisporosarcina sp.]
MKNLGHMIKLERVKRNMKQITLAKGICTPSYLSKIENNSVDPSQEVVNLLLARLELKISQDKNLDDESYLAYIRNIYFEAVMNKDRKLTLAKLEEIQAKQYLFSEMSNYYTYQLMIFRLSLIVYDLKRDGGDMVIALSEMSPNFNDYQSFLFHANVGMSYSLKTDYAASLDALEVANEYFKKISIDKWEEADFYYLLAHVYFVHQRWVISVEYIQKALEFFKNGFYNTRVVECYLILSGAQDRSHKTDEAVKNLLLAQKIATQLNLSEHIHVITHNLGTFSSTKEEHEKAIAYFKESFELKTDNTQKIYPIFSLIREYSKLGQADEVVKWASLGLEYIQSDETFSLNNYYHHFKVYQSRNSGLKDFEKISINAIHFFKDVKDYRFAQKYSLFLAEYYNENAKYKNAAKYYALSNEFMFKKQKVDFWEDL